MKVWEIVIKVRSGFWNEATYTYLGVAKTMAVAIRQVLRLAKKDDLVCVSIVSARRLGDLDFCTKRK